MSKEKRQKVKKTKSLNDWTRAELLKLPVRRWDAPSVYDTLLLLSTGKKHESGWAMIAIIGVRKGQPVEIASRCTDDIEWSSPSIASFGDSPVGRLRTDCAFRSGAIHAWMRGFAFLVGPAFSSLGVVMLPTKPKEPKP